jgi:antirestriction protein ArdC
MKTDIYQIITEKLISSLEKGVNPWRKPWKGGGIPRNAITGRGYSGINYFLLSAHGGGKFLTYKQAQGLGGSVRKGEKGCPVVFWNWIEKEKNGKTDKIPFLKYFTVFSVEQCEGLEFPSEEGEEKLDFIPIESAEETIAKTGADIRHGGNQAFYVPLFDHIALPKRESFNDIASYYGTAFHELIHWTGHTSRLARKGIETVAPFGSAIYSKEELIAEMGAAFLCGQHGIDSTIENSAAYLQGWIKALKGDSKLALQAASAASKAADFILGKKTEGGEA